MYTLNNTLKYLTMSSLGEIIERNRRIFKLMEVAEKLSRVEDAYERLKDEIRNNRIPPGLQAPEPELALRLGMSRTPVREALIKLQAEGLVELIPRRGVRILPLRAHDMREIYEILTVLEPDAAAKLAARKPSDEELLPLAKATSDMEMALKKQDLNLWAEADDRFHIELLELQNNRRLRDFVMTLYDQTHRARIVTMRMRDVPKESTEEHREILEHLSRGDAKAVRRVFKAHRQRASEELLSILEKYKLGQL